MLKSNHLRAVAALLFASLLFSLGGVFIKLSTWDAIPLNGARSGVSALVIAIILWWFRQGDWPPRPTFTRNMILGAVARKRRPWRPVTLAEPPQNNGDDQCRNATACPVERNGIPCR